METKNVVAELIKNGATMVKDIKIKNVTVTEEEEYCRLGLTINKEVDGYRANVETGSYEPSKTNIVFTSTYAMGAVLKDNDDAAFAANELIDNPKGFQVILSRANITIVQEPVTAGQVYKNPFSSNDSEGRVFDHDTIINHIVDIKLSDFGIKYLDNLAMRMLGF